MMNKRLPYKKNKSKETSKKIPNFVPTTLEPKIILFAAQCPGKVSIFEFAKLLTDLELDLILLLCLKTIWPWTGYWKSELGFGYKMGYRLLCSMAVRIKLISGHMKILGPDLACTGLQGESICPGLCSVKTVRSVDALIGSPVKSDQVSLPLGRSKLRNFLFGSSSWIQGSSLGHFLLFQEISNADCSLCDSSNLSPHSWTQLPCPKIPSPTCQDRADSS